MFLHARLRAARDARERDRRAQDAGMTLNAGRASAYAPSARAGRAVRPRDRLREPAAVLAVDPAGGRHAVLAVRAVAAALDALRRRSPTSSRTCRSACSWRSRRAAQRHSRARSWRSRPGSRWRFALETLQSYLPPRDASVIDLAANAGGAFVGGMAGGLAHARAARARRAVVGAQSRVPAGQARRSRHRAAGRLDRRADQSRDPALLRHVRRRPAQTVGAMSAEAGARHRGHADRGGARRDCSWSASASFSRCCCATGASSAARCSCSSAPRCWSRVRRRCSC